MFKYETRAVLYDFSARTSGSTALGVLPGRSASITIPPVGSELRISSLFVVVVCVLLLLLGFKQG